MFNRQSDKEERLINSPPSLSDHGKISPVFSTAPKPVAVRENISSRGKGLGSSSIRNPHSCARQAAQTPLERALECKLHGSRENDVKRNINCSEMSHLGSLI